MTVLPTQLTVVPLFLPVVWLWSHLCPVQHSTLPSHFAVRQCRQRVKLMASGDLTLPTMSVEMEVKAYKNISYFLFPCSYAAMHTYRYPNMHAGTSFSGEKVELSTGGALAITAVLCSVVFFVLGVLSTLLVVYCITAKRAKYSVSSSSTEPQIPAPLYEEVTTTDTKPRGIELNENIAYGPARL